MLHPITVDMTVFFLCVLCSDVECHYPVSLLILQLMSYFIMLITNITDIFMVMVTPFELQIKAFWNWVILALQ